MMPLLRIHRSSRRFWIAIACVIGAHLLLCHPAATCRGYPPIREHEIWMMFIAPFFVGLPAFFHDSRSTRTRGVIVASIGMALIYGIVMANFQSARPHIGHLAGMIGVVRYFWLMIPFLAIGPFIGLCVSLFVYERVTGDFWPLVRGFRAVDEPDG